MRRASCWALAAGLLASAPAAALEIERARADRLLFEPAKGESVQVAFRLSEPAHVTLRLYDGRDLPVREVASQGLLPAGEHALVWDGRDAAGRPVPPEAYAWVLVARGEDGSEVVYDLTDATGGEKVAASRVAWDAEAGAVRFVLPATSRVNVRIGLPNGGPLLRTLVDWAPREAGAQEVPWDGADASGVLALGGHPQVTPVVNAFALPENTILVGPLPDESAWIDPVPWEAPPRTQNVPTGRERRAYAAQPMEVRRDVAVALELPAELPRNGDGHPIVSAPVPVRLTVPDPAEAERMLAERFETAFFLDGQFRFEAEVGYLPATWIFDPKGVGPGRHYLTGNLLGYEGHFGIATVVVEVAAGAEPDASGEGSE